MAPQPSPKPSTAPGCPYCGGGSVLTDSAEVYRKSYGPIYICRPCRAWVGCHDGTTTPLGRLANAELREAKKQAHAAFDPIWQARRGDGRPLRMGRSAAYRWLADEMGIDRAACHIGMFDVEQCRQVVALAQAYLNPARDDAPDEAEAPSP